LSAVLPISPAKAGHTRTPSRKINRPLSSSVLSSTEWGFHSSRIAPRDETPNSPLLHPAAASLPSANVIEQLFIEAQRRIRATCAFTMAASCERILF
jgi:hypothetical protein